MGFAECLVIFRAVAFGLVLHAVVKKAAFHPESAFFDNFRWLAAPEIGELVNVPIVGQRTRLVENQNA